MKLTDICDFQGGSQPPKNQWSDEKKDGYIRMLQIRDYTQNNSKVEYIKVTNSTKTCKEKDILIARYGASIGKILTGLSGAYNVAMMKVIIDENKVDRNFIYNFLKSNIFQNYIKNVGERAAQAGFNKDELSKIEINLPILKEQRNIANKLDKVQEIINLRKKQLEELEKLIKFQFVEMFGNLKNNDKNWEYVDEIGKVCILNPKKSEVANINNIEVSFIPMQAVSDKGDIDTSEIRFLNDVKSGFSYFIENDVLFAKITPCMENGKGAVAKGLKNNIGFGSTEFHVLRPKEKINSIWLYTLTTLDSFRKEAEMKMTGSAGQKRVPTKFFEDYKIGIPPINLQNKFESFVQLINKQKFMIEKSLKETEELQESLMNKYFGE